MSLLMANELGWSYGATSIFADVSLRIEADDRIGLVGPNGEGKTTLLRLIAGLDSPTTGSIHRRRDLRVGYLAQDDGQPLPDQDLWTATLSAFDSLRALERQLQEQADQLADEDALRRYAQMQAEFERLDGYTYESRIKQVLEGLGFDAPDFRRPLAEFSGGQRTRASLARLLLEAPDLLLLDEPTNYLDLEAVEWLEHWLSEAQVSYVIVSHDRYFLDRVSGRIWEMAFGRLETYRGNYSAYARQRQERYERRLKEWETQQAYVAKTEDFVRRFLAGQRTKEAQGRRKRLARYLRDEGVDKPQQHKRVHLNLGDAERSGDEVLGLRDLQLGYSDTAPPLVQAPEALIERGERIAVIGSNGAGKTTLVRTILGELAPLSGELRLGARVQVGYLPQLQEHLDPGHTVLDAVQEVSPESKPAELRNLLGGFLLSGDDVDKRISELSGGERSRVSLARLVLAGANFLILDEPTNHLDITSQEVLEQVLEDFGGTILLVSHDRYLIQSLATGIWSVADGELSSFDGDWEAYVLWRERQVVELESATGKASSRQQTREEQREARRLRKQREKALARQEEVEQQIAQLENDKDGIGEQIGKAGERQDLDAVAELSQKLQQMERQIAALYSEWENLATGLEEGLAETPMG
ncbi:MAG: ABC transporter [Gemmatimonadetes bacterium]|nr:ABC transporter [Gemmatimonadota bacterium]HCV25163.1 ABC transporter ATP-binding protein [Candidatus Latescibacterota bacterium]